MIPYQCQNVPEVAFAAIVQAAGYLCLSLVQLQKKVPVICYGTVTTVATVAS